MQIFLWIASIDIQVTHTKQVPSGVVKVIVAIVLQGFMHSFDKTERHTFQFAVLQPAGMVL